MRRLCCSPIFLLLLLASVATAKPRPGHVDGGAQEVLPLPPAVTDPLPRQATQSPRPAPTEPPGDPTPVFLCFGALVVLVGFITWRVGPARRRRAGPIAEPTPPRSQFASRPGARPLRVDVSALKVTVPAVCACCGMPLPSLPVRQVTLDQPGYELPLCGECVRHRPLDATAHGLSGAGCGLLLLAFPTLGLALIPFFVMRAQQQREARAARTGSCVLTPRVQALRLMSRHGSRVSLEFPQHAFGLAFLNANAPKVVNAPYDMLRRAEEFAKKPC